MGSGFVIDGNLKIIKCNSGWKFGRNLIIIMKKSLNSIKKVKRIYKES